MAAIVPDNLTTRQNVMDTLGITATAELALLNLLIPEVSTAIAERWKRPVLLLSNAANPVTRLYSGKGSNWLLLQDRPVYTPVLTGNTTAGSAIVTNIAGGSGPNPTSYLFVNQPVTGATLPTAPSGTANVAIASINSPTQVTLTQPAATTGTAVSLFFGLNVWEDDAGYWGQSPQSFPSTSQLTWGSDYTIRADELDGSSRSGMLLRQNNVWETQFMRGGDMLSEMLASGFGNIKVQSMVGWPTVPANVELAVIRLIAKCRATRIYGEMIASQNFQGYSYSTSPFKGTINFGLIDDPLFAGYMGGNLGE